jgi:hypothetical protein
MIAAALLSIFLSPSMVILTGIMVIIITSMNTEIRSTKDTGYVRTMRIALFVFGIFVWVMGVILIALTFVAPAIDAFIFGGIALVCAIRA